ncbi:MAG: hypothetical protein H7263_07595, partial [Candidatus Sericytochromatia bacterium]|nr:hypothetical protein [Candidatus Sericytochromatia bacterium]
FVGSDNLEKLPDILEQKTNNIQTNKPSLNSPDRDINVVETNNLNNIIENENNNVESSLVIEPKIINYQGKEKLIVNIDNKNVIIDLNKLKNFESLYQLNKTDNNINLPNINHIIDSKIPVEDNSDESINNRQINQSESEPTFEQKINLVRQLINLNEGKKDNNFRIKFEQPENIDSSNDSEILEQNNNNSSRTNTIKEKSPKSEIKLSFESLLNSILSDPKAKNLTVENISNLVAFKQTYEEENVLVKNPETKEFQMFKISKEDNKKLKSDNITDIENAPLFNTLDNKETKKDENNKFVSIDLENSNDSKPIPLDKPIKINHQGHEKILINKGDKNIFIDIDKLKYFDDHKAPINNQETKNINLLNGLIDEEQNLLSKNNLNVIHEDANKMNNLLKNFLSNDVLDANENLSQQINMMSQMFGVFETQVKKLKQELEPFKHEESEEFSLENPFTNLLSPKKVSVKTEKPDKKDSHSPKLSFEKLLNSVLSEISSRVEKISLNLQGREILSNNEKCFCIPLSIPYGNLKFNGEILIKDEKNKRTQSGGKVLSITLAVETKNLNQVMIDFLSIDKDLQISIKVDNKNIKDIFDQKLIFINELMQTSKYKVKPITCMVNPNKNRGNSLLVPRNSFPKSLRRIEGII